MFKLKKDEFIKYMDSVRLLVSVDDKQYEIIPELKIYANLDLVSSKAEIIVKGYRIREGKWDSLKRTLYLNDDVNLVHQTRDNILKIINAGEFIDVIMIDEYYSMDEYLDNIAMSDASMEYILNKYSDCNRMSLVTCYLEDYGITESEAKEILEELKENNLAYIKRIYDRHEIAEDLDAIIKNIKKECSLFEERFSYKYGNNFSNSFIGDHVGKDTYYNEPVSFFGHTYRILGNELDCEKIVKKHLNNLNYNKILEFLDNYPKLKNNYISHKITFNTYVTGGPLQIIYYFKLNDETKEYLLGFKDDYSFNNGLEDLALYKDNKILYASCTHEKFRDDYSKESN